MTKAYQLVKKARDSNRIRAKEIIEGLLDQILYLHGDRKFGDSPALVAGLGEFEGQALTFIGIQKGADLEEGLATNFGMVKPEGYRQAVRLMEQAEKFRRPLVTFIDTPGAYPGVDAEERGQFEAIASSLEKMASLTVPVLSFIIGEGGSGGALALALANKVYMFENSVYSILSPEGFASILWKDAKLADQAADLMKLTGQDLLDFGIIDGLLDEKGQGQPDYEQIKEVLRRDLEDLTGLSGQEIQAQRYEKFRKMGR